MIINLYNTEAQVASAKPREARWLYEYLSFPDVQARFRRLPRWKRGDGLVHMMSDTTQTFPAGFIGAVRKQAEKDGVKVEIVDKRGVARDMDPKPLLDWLRDYQLEAIREAMTFERGIFHHVTAAGKTEVMVGVAELYPINWLILVHSKDLVMQIIDRFSRRTGEECGVIMEGKKVIRRITVATFQSVLAGVHRKDKQIINLLTRNARGLMVDEAHKVPAATFYRIVMATQAYYRYGFSGTPFQRGDKKSIYLWGAIGPVIHRIPAERLIAAGVLAKPKIRCVTLRQVITGKNWAEAYRIGITESAPRNRLLVQIAKKATKPALLFVKEVKHGKALEKALRAAGEKVEFVWGDAHTKVRQAAVRRLVHGDTDVLICSVIFQEGIDIPELQSVIIGSGGKSVIMALQDVGRGMRRTNRQGKITKEEFEVWDIADRACTPACKTLKKHMGCKWLEKHTRGRMRAFAIEKYEVVEVPAV